MAGSVAGGLVAGLGITMLLLAGERKSGKPSELADIERAGMAQLGYDIPSPATLSDAREQAVIQSGHLLLSAAAGAVYAASTNEDKAAVPSGIGFGIAFYAAMHWIVGPLAGLKAPEWQSGKATIAMHALNHIGFGIVTAVGAKLATER